MIRQFLVAGIAAAVAGCGPRMDTPAPIVPAQLSAMKSSVAGNAALIAGEAHLFRSTRPITTVYPISRIVRVYSFDDHGREINYTASDWTLTRGRLSRSPSSKIPDFAIYRYSTRTGCAIGPMACLRSLRYITNANAFDVELAPRNPPPTINLNVYLDYLAHVGTPLVKARRTGTENARRVLCVGDSITAGSHTVDLVYRHRDDQSWCGRLYQLSLTFTHEPIGAVRAT